MLRLLPLLLALSIALPARADIIDAPPRTQLVLTSFSVGVWLGLSGALALDVDARAGAGLILLGGLGSGAVAYLATSGMNVRPAMPIMLGYGTSYGAATALTLLSLGDTDTAFWPALFGGSLLGAVGGLAMVPLLDMSGGDAGASGFLSIFAGGVTLLTMALTFSEIDSTASITIPMWLAASAGFFGGPFINRVLQFSGTRWNVISVASGAGTLTGALLAFIFGVGSGRGWIGALLLGTVGGAAIGAAATGWMAPDSRAALEPGVPSRNAFASLARPLERNVREPSTAFALPLASTTF